MGGFGLVNHLACLKVANENANFANINGRLMNVGPHAWVKGAAPGVSPTHTYAHTTGAIAIANVQIQPRPANNATSNVHNIFGGLNANPNTVFRIDIVSLPTQASQNGFQLYFCPTRLQVVGVGG
jgi:hypothetical protein